MENKICSHCNNPQPISKFWKNKTKKDGYDNTCSDCRNLYYKKRDKEAHKKWAQNYRLKQQNKEYEKQFRVKYKASFNGIVTDLLSAAKYRALSKNLEFNLTREWLIEKLKPFKCEKTNLPLTKDKFKTSSNKKAHPYAPSIDRIHCSKGYTKDNCQIVCWIYNVAKSNFNEEDVLLMAQALATVSQ